jgi:hypothetical protein
MAGPGTGSVENTLTYDNRFGDHTVKVLVGQGAAIIQLQANNRNGLKTYLTTAMVIIIYH